MRAAAIDGLDGTLIGSRAAADWLSGVEAGALSRAAASVAHWAAHACASLGPSASERRLLEELENLFTRGLGFRCLQRAGHSIATTPAGAVIVLSALPWSRPMSPPQRAVLRACIDAGADWAVVFNGAALAIVD